MPIWPEGSRFPFSSEASRALMRPARAANMQMPHLTDANTRRVVAAVFQPFQSFQQQGLSILFSNICDDSTHLLCLTLTNYRNTDVPALCIIIGQITAAS